MSDNRKPAIRIWPFGDAPEEFRRLSPWGDGTEQLLIHVPMQLWRLLENDDSVLPPVFWFLENVPKFNGHIQYAGEGMGWYYLALLPNGDRIAVTTQNDD
jgi:hypothetical protein